MSTVTLPQSTLDMGDGHYMQITAELHDDLTCAFDLHMTNTNKVSGFTSGVILHYFNSQGQEIGTTRTPDMV